VPNSIALWRKLILAWRQLAAELAAEPDEHLVLGPLESTCCSSGETGWSPGFEKRAQ